ncbi:MAG: T9SS type A sorting domain-containing protein [Bacteroidota bacterium]
MKNTWYLFVLFLMTTSGLYAQIGGQNNTCETAAPFCTGTLYSFPAGVNSPPGQTGPFYSCLTTRPNPAWYYMKVATPGNIIISMHSEPSKDIDFCCWGPFTSQFCCDQLLQPKVVSCSYSSAASETCNIPNGLTGQYYMLIITNFSNQPCNIIFQQTGGTGTTDCSILPPPCFNNSPICTGQTLQFSAQAISGATYHWWGPAGFTSTVQNPSIPNATVANTGEYFLRVEVNGQSSADTSTTMAYVYHPQANAGNDTTIMNGVSTKLHGNCTNGSGSYHYRWAPSSKLINDSVRDPQTTNLFSTTVFTLTATDDSASCQAIDMVTVNISGGALAVNAVATPQSICLGNSSILEAIGSGGAGNYTYSWTGPNGFTSSLPNPTVAPVITSEYHVSAFDGYNTVNGSVTVTVLPLPDAFAGMPKSIPYGTYTFLNGSVLNGNGDYYYSWLPADKLVNAGLQHPQTTNLTSTTVYTLVVTNLLTNCVSNNGASVPVEVTGGPLNVNPVATPSFICKGDTTRLHASAGGGNVGFYQYSWSSVPAGYTSTEADPLVNPFVNTTYSVSVTDQFNSTQGSTAVSIYPEPLIRLGPADTTVCIYDTVTLDAGNAGSTYLWSNGSVDRHIRFGSTGIGYDTQTYSVHVVNQHGCEGDAAINVIFSFDVCVGIDEQTFSDHIRIYPNPTTGKIQIETDGMPGQVNGSVLSALGKTLRNFSMPGTTNGKSLLNLDISDLPKGIYLVRFSDESFVHIHKLVLE